MPQAIVQVLVVAGTLKGTAATVATIAAAVVEIAAVSAYQKKKAKEAEEKLRSRVDVMIRSATEPSRIIYGERRVSGPLAFANVRLSTGTADNSDLWQVVALAGHEVNAITDLYLDGDKIPAASINGSGEVTSGKYGPVSGRTAVQILKNLGTDSQSALSLGFTDWTTNHRLRGVAHIATRFELSNRGSAGLWKNGAPSDVRVVVQGKKVYDPRLDSTAGGSGSHRVTDPSTWEYSANPALCLADYMIDSRLGMGQEGITYDDIDYGMVATAADQCDAAVSIPGGGTEPRYEINGVLFSTDSYETNIRAILKCMNGSMVWSNGQFRIRAGEYEAPVESFDEADIVGTVAISTEFGRDQRFNKIRGTYQNADEDYDLTQYIPVTDANLIANRDNGVELVETIDQPLVTSEYQAQRLAFKLIQINNQQLRATIPLNYRAMNVRVGDRIQVSVDALNWSNKVFRVEGWKFGVEDGFVLSVIEDSSTAYDDPEVADYSTRSATGTITFADPPVPSPSGLTVTSQRNGILVQWDEPEPPVLYDEVQVFASPDSSWSNAVLVASTRGTTFFHDLDPGTQRYYWARSIDNKDELSDRDPDSDTSSVVATAGAVGAGDVDGISAGQNLLPRSAALERSTAARFGTIYTLELADIGMDPGDELGFSGEVKSNLGNDQIAVYVEYYNGGTYLSAATAVASASTTYQRVQGVSTIPASTTQIKVFSYNVSNTGDTQFARRLMLNRGSVALPFEEPPARVNRGEVEEGAQVNGAGSLAVVINRELDDTLQDGELCLLGVVNGEPDFGTDGFIFWDGSKITIERNQSGAPPGVTLLTGASRSLGHIVFDTAKGNPFTVAGVAMDVAFARRNGSGWEYDNNGSWVSFTPDDDMVSLGPMDAGGDFIYGAALWGQPIRLVDAPQARAGLWSELLDDDGNIPAPRATRGVIDAASAETDGEVTNASTTTYTTAQTLTFTLSESTTVVITMSGLIYRKFSSSTTFSTVIAEKDGVEIGGMSALNTFVPGTAYLPWVYRREETLGAGTYTYRFRFKQVAGGITTAFRNRVITVEEIL